MMQKKHTIAAIYPTYSGGGVPAIGKLATLLDDELMQSSELYKSLYETQIVGPE